MKPIDWLSDEWFTLFTKKETNAAIRAANITTNDLTDVENFTQEPWHKKKELVKDWHWDSITDTKIINGVAYEARVRKQVQSWRIPARYQGLKHAAIIRKILEARFPWFNMFKWSIYELSDAENYEIYMDTENGTLYVPIKALLERNPKIIEERMKSYHKWYYNVAGYKLNHKENETVEQYKKRREQDYEKAISPLQSREYKYLCKLMEIDEEMKQ